MVWEESEHPYPESIRVRKMIRSERILNDCNDNSNGGHACHRLEGADNLLVVFDDQCHIIEGHHSLSFYTSSGKMFISTVGTFINKLLTSS